MKRKLTCKVIKDFNNDLQTFSSQHAEGKNVSMES